MIYLLAGLALFVGIHLIPVAPSLRHSLVARFGSTGYQGLFSVLSLAGFALIIVGMRTVPFDPVWRPDSSLKVIPQYAMLVAFILLPATWIGGSIKRLVRHPMMLAVMIWSASHLVAVGDKSAMLLFGAMLAWSTTGFVSALKRDVGSRAAVDTSLVRDVAVVAVGAALWYGVGRGHAWISGMPAFY